LNYDEIKEKLYKYRPSLLIVGASAYPRIIDFERVRKLVDEYNEWQKENDLKNAKLYNEGKIADLTPDSYPQYKHCYLMVDMAHIAGLVAAGLHPSPLPYADVVTSTVQKTLRSGRGGLILTNSEDLIKKINSAVFPRLQGGPLNNMIAAKAVGFNEALQPEFKQYIQQVKKNIQAMCEVFKEREVKMMTNGSDNHLILLDLKDEQFTGADLEKLLESIGVIANKNSVKGDTRPKMETSGLRLGTACITTRGATENDAKWIAHLVCNCIEILRGTFDYEGSGLLRVREDGSIDEESDIKTLVINDMSRKVKNWCKDHPIYKED
jgi:glycine hydroxymethyltransferase